MDDGKKIIFGKYEMGKVLGQGSFAKVYHGRKLDTNESVAIKVINKEQLNLKMKMDQQIEREISVMRIIRHPNVVELKEVMATKAKIFFVMEYVKGGELFAKVLRGRLKEEHARKYFQQLISAVDYCHSRGVSHRDLKPENLLVDDNGNLKVSDFGLSALPEQLRHDGLLHTQCGTPAYVAPEVLRKKGYSGEKADQWSCGVVLFVLLAGYLPFQDENVMNMYRKVFTAEYQFPPWFPNDARWLVSKLLVVDPDKRLSVEGIMRAPWFFKGFTATATTIPFHGSQYPHLGQTPPPPPPPPQPQKLQELPQEEEEKEKEKEKEEALTSEMEMNMNMNMKNKLTRSRSGFYNAFELISSLSSGFDLSGLFITDDINNDHRSRRRSTSTSSIFTSRLPARGVRTKIESEAKKLNFSILNHKKKKNIDNNNNDDEYCYLSLMMESKLDGRKGKLGLVADVFEVAPELAVVELSKSSGDTFEYYDFCDQHLRPALKDIVWTWPGGQPTN